MFFMKLSKVIILSIIGTISSAVGKPVITSVSPAKPKRKVSIHEEIAPMRGNSLGNLLKDIKV